jgi:hypothetical protein
MIKLKRRGKKLKKRLGKSGVPWLHRPLPHRLRRLERRRLLACGRGSLINRVMGETRHIPLEGQGIPDEQLEMLMSKHRRHMKVQ